MYVNLQNSSGGATSYAVSRTDGALQWSVETRANPCALAAGVLYTDKGVAFDASDGSKQFEYPDKSGEAAVEGETLYLAGDGLTALTTDSAATTARGETGSVTLGAKDRDHWHTVEFQRSYDDPVVVMQPPSHEGTHPVHVRLRHVTSGGFEFKLEEWLYLNGGHAPEHISYLVLEAGHYTLDNGLTVDVGRTRADNYWRSGTFASPRSC